MREPKNQMLGTMEPPLMQLTVKASRVTKPKTNHPATKNHNGNRKAKSSKKSASHRRLKY